MNTHTEAYDADTRDAQRDELLAANAVDGPVVVVGDFNAVPEQVGMPAEFEDAWLAVRGVEAGHTCGQAADLGNEASLLRERIDYIWVRGADVRECAVVGGDGSDRTARRGLWPSDHACVVAEIALSVGGPTA